MLRAAAKRFLPGPAIEMLRLLRRDDWIRRMLAGQELDVALVEEHLTPADGVVVDVGAERGEVTLHFAARGFRVIAFEPSKLTARALRMRSWRYRRVTIREEACGAEQAISHMDESGASWEHRLSTTGREVRVVRLADVLDHQPIALLKVDAEGHDLDVLRGYFDGSRPLPKATMFEFTQGSLEEPLQLLKDAGYQHFRFVCRWQESPDLPAQLRSAVFDGEDPLIFAAAWGNAIASTVPYRLYHPLT